VLSIRSALPLRAAAIICEAALSALIEIPGKVEPRLNQAASALVSPLTLAFRYEPVRIRPGTMVTIRMPVDCNSARSPSE
jgi:hypothetical protein